MVSGLFHKDQTHTHTQNSCLLGPNKFQSIVILPDETPFSHTMILH